MSKSVIIIPSRLAATRLPNKPLLRVNEKTLIMHVYEKAVKSEIGDVYVATCDDEIANEVQKNGGKIITTDASHESGTDRVFEAAKKLDLQQTDYIINVQGDEPMIDPLDIKNLNFVSKEKNLDFSTLAFNISNNDNYKEENIVKVFTRDKITNLSSSVAENFSRKVNFKNISDKIYHHYGIYLYKFNTLEKFVKLDHSKNEKIEKLEQLRALDNNMKIYVLLASHFSIGIDTIENLLEYKKIMKKTKK
ncbi:3-deoxy-manno-octulosonate cytidylyltransferase [Candidatus Pelagibacter sp.]|nr:3-deoxy-manno-octulosonate cytidylyltransferase [Candidatus Pelagibacter sp.]